ncbi:hypothetical protein [Streptomyces sp. TRM70350]|uniref:hypothetical protein n=1 Tax=Streptomyces sp. TRM70350 TaxID=2856165 RepID=UPI001C466130|nr:hypothetical protein [Streptomyces sp. TRM70350]MBV7696607.1 hypothetical protein [Streptomyces sp. TRM70350]
MSGIIRLTVIAAFLSAFVVEGSGMAGAASGPDLAEWNAPVPHCAADSGDDTGWD